MDWRTGDRQPSLLTRCQHRTRELHLEAEKSGIVREILRGKASRSGYALLLRNLLPVYRRLEGGLEAHRGTPGLGLIAIPALYRSAAISSDLSQLCGNEWSTALPVLASAERYMERVALAAQTGGHGLIAHSYVRYMGDLNGGQILKRLLARSLNLAPAMLSFYDFPGIADLDAFKADYRDCLEQAGLQVTDAESIVEEAAEAFRLNIALSKEIEELADSGEASPPD
ncbi:MAG: heme oxygenase (biliverdin-producing) [Rhodomicrobiaceae bacterium]